MVSFNLEMLDELYSKIKIVFSKYWHNTDEFEEECFYQFLVMLVLTIDLIKFDETFSEIDSDERPTHLIADEETVAMFWKKRNTDMVNKWALNDVEILFDQRDERVANYHSMFLNVFKTNYVLNGQPTDEDITIIMSFARQIFMNVEKKDIVSAYDPERGIKLINTILNVYILYLQIKTNNRVL